MMQKKIELLRKTGHIHQVADVTPIEYREGRADKLSAWQVKNGPLSFTVMQGKGMDLSELSYKGINFSFLSKPGLQGRNQYDTNGQEALRSIMGGMLFTCGLENICAVYQNGETQYPMHGRIRTTPAEHTAVRTRWTSEGYEMELYGEMREAELFGENLVLKRTITTIWPKKEIRIRDVIENQSFREEPLRLWYHINAGYPLLDEEAEILIPARKTTPRDADAKRQMENWSTMEAPVDNEPEAVFLHELYAEENGKTEVAVINPKLGLGFSVEFSGKELPYFMEWKSTASGDYVVGLEPANSSVYGRAYHEKQNTLHTIGPMESETKELTLRILEGQELEEMRGKINDKFRHQ